MDILFWLIPVSLILGALGLGAFVWTLKSRQYEDPTGDAARILLTDWDCQPKPEPTQPRKR